MSDDAVASDGETTLTSLLGGRLSLRQPRAGHRVGTDAVLLAAAVTPRPGEMVLDAGSGVGSVGLAIAVRHPGVNVHLLEIAPTLAAYAQDNAIRNGVAGRVAVEEGDLMSPGRGRDRVRVDWVVSNPPFQVDGAARPSPNAGRVLAHHLRSGLTHGDWMRALLRHVRPGGAVVLIHRPDALPALLAAAAGRLGGVRVLPILPREGEAAIRVLVSGRAGSRAPFSILAPLVLHGDAGGFLPRAAALHEGRETMSMVQTTKNRPRGPVSPSQP